MGGDHCPSSSSVHAEPGHNRCCCSIRDLSCSCSPLAFNPKKSVTHFRTLRKACDVLGVSYTHRKSLGKRCRKNVH